jgi:hypothetical protein
VVNKLSDLADFLENDSIPAWVKEQLAEKRDLIVQALNQGQPYQLTGPKGEVVTITPSKAVAA